MQKHIELLERILADGPIKHIGSGSDFDVNLVEELFNHGLIEAIEHAPLNGRQFLNVRINMAGRAWLEDRKKSNEISRGLDGEDLIDIKPNFMGVGVNINAMWRKLFSKNP